MYHQGLQLFKALPKRDVAGRGYACDLAMPVNLRKSIFTVEQTGSWAGRAGQTTPTTNHPAPQGY